MPRSALAVLLLVVAVSVLDGAAPPAAGARERWRRPLLGGAAIVGPFTFERSAPYERGRRRGIDLAAPPGTRVVAACGGVVGYAGGVPGWGRGVALRCDGGGLVATELGLARVAVARGAHVLAGSVVGRLGARGVLRLGTRRAEDRHGYVDPLPLLAAPGEAPPSVAPPAPGGAPRRRAAPPPPPRVLAPRSAPAPHRAAAPRNALAQPAVLLGLVLLAAALGGGVTTRRTRRRRRRAGMVVAHRYR
jgi:Peptidase family M23